MDFNVLRGMVGVECDHVDVEVYAPRLEGSLRRDISRCNEGDCISTKGFVNREMLFSRL